MSETMWGPGTGAGGGGGRDAPPPASAARPGAVAGAKMVSVIPWA